MSTEAGGPVAWLIRASLRHRFVVYLGAFALVLGALQSARHTALDALPDLSEVQVTVRASAPGMPPQLVEDLVTYPLSRALQGTPGARTVRGYSFFGDAFVYVIFADGTDLYWARSRVQEALAQARLALPAGVSPALGPDATGVGWVYSYALVDRSGAHGLDTLRSLQDWYLRLELEGLPGVAEVASVGGMVREYQVVADAEKLAERGLTVAQLRAALASSNLEVGGGVLEQGGREYMVRSRGLLRGIADIEAIAIGEPVAGNSAVLADVAQVRLGPALRRVVTDLDGEGEVAGGIVVMRDGANALDTIRGVRERLRVLAGSLPPGVEIVETYDRSELILASVRNLRDKVALELAIVALVCVIFLLHLRSALIAVITLPLGILAALSIMQSQGISANIMSLGGIALAIGTMVDAAIVLIENTHKHLERYRREHGDDATAAERWRIVAEAAVEVGPALFFSLLIITVSFLPVLLLEAQEGKLFTPLALTKTYAMAAAALLSVTLVPALLGAFLRGHAPDEARNPLNRALAALYRPLLAACLRRGVPALVLIILLCGSALYPATRLAREFMPTFFEGDVMYMPTTLPGIAIGEARRLLQRSNQLIMQVPEVSSVFGKMGRADTATDPAPLTMVETIVRLRPRDEWRPGLTEQQLLQQLDAQVSLPGVRNAWVMPIRTRIDMQSTGVKTPLGIRLAANSLDDLDAAARSIEALLDRLPGTRSIIAERPAEGRYLDITPDRDALARHGLSMTAFSEIVATAVGGSVVNETLEGRERYPVNLRFAQAARDSVEDLERLLFATPAGTRITLGDVATLQTVVGPATIRSESGRLSSWLYIVPEGDDLAAYREQAEQVLRAEFSPPAGVSYSWTGQYEYLERASQRLLQIVPLTLLLIVALLYAVFRRGAEIALVLTCIPLATSGGLWLMYLLGHALSVASWVGFIALAGVAVEFGVLMLLYLNAALAEDGPPATRDALRSTVIRGAVQRLRPKTMTVAVIIAGLLPIMLVAGTGSEVMQRIAAPMLGGMLSAPLLSLFFVPIAFYAWHARDLPRTTRAKKPSIS